ncbi:MAG: ABC transporter substrate-binding protein [Spirochaetaceae bacterium]|nr:ABC transporter substrate-binding protein [Spirochaetaceae bacterium]
MKKFTFSILLLLCLVPINLFASGIKENTQKSLSDNGIISIEKTYTDSLNREITIPKNVNTVISLGPNLTEIIATLKPEALVGRTDYCDYPQWVQNVFSIGNLSSPNLEKIIEIDPDLVVGSTHVKKETIGALEKAGITTVSLYDSSSIEGSYKVVLDMGTLLNQEEKAQEIVKNMKAEINEVSKTVAKLNKPKVYYIVSFGQYGEYTAGGNTFIGQMITLAGGNNIANDIKGWSFSLEKLVEDDPDIIIISQYRNEMENFLSTKPYNELRAVKEHHIYTIDNNKLDRQGIRNAEGVKDLAIIIHPEAFN